MPLKIRVENFQSITSTEIVVEGFTAITGQNNSGKALAHGTPVVTPGGRVSVQDICVGDVITAGDGSPTKVLGVYPQGMRDTYLVTLNDGRSVRVDYDHLWRARELGATGWSTLSTKEVVDLLSHGSRVQVPRNGFVLRTVDPEFPDDVMFQIGRHYMRSAVPGLSGVTSWWLRHPSGGDGEPVVIPFDGRSSFADFTDFVGSDQDRRAFVEGFFRDVSPSRYVGICGEHADILVEYLRSAGVPVWCNVKDVDLDCPEVRSVAYAGQELCTCLEVDHPERTFQVGDYVVTHNTALMRAVQGVFSNSPADHLVRNGTDKLSVTLDFGEGQSVTWSKGPKHKPSYEIMGKVVQPGRGVPDEVMALGIQPVQAGGGVVWPQVASQFVGQVFLLDQPGSSIAEVVADVERVGRYTSALRFAESDKRQAASDLRVRREDLQSKVSQLSRYDDLPQISERVKQAETALAKVTTAIASLKAVRSVRDRLRAATQEVSQYAWVRDLKPIPDVKLSELSATVGRIAHLRVLRERMERAHQEVRSTSWVRDMRTLPNLSLLERRVSDHAALVAARDKLKTVRLNVSSLRQQERDLSTMHQEVFSMDLNTLSQRSALLKKLQSISTARVRMTREIQTIQDDMVSHQAELDTLRIPPEYESCPLCGTPVEDDLC